MLCLCKCHSGAATKKTEHSCSEDKLWTELCKRCRRLRLLFRVGGTFQIIVSFSTLCSATQKEWWIFTAGPAGPSHTQQAEAGNTNFCRNQRALSLISLFASVVWLTEKKCGVSRTNRNRNRSILCPEVSIELGWRQIPQCQLIGRFCSESETCGSFLS